MTQLLGVRLRSWSYIVTSCITGCGKFGNRLAYVIPERAVGDKKLDHSWTKIDKGKNRAGYSGIYLQTFDTKMSRTVRGLQIFGTALVALRFLSYRSAAMAHTNPEDWKNASSVYDFTAKDIKGEEVSLEKYKGHVLLIVNVASKCGLTETNYKELVELHNNFSESKGLRILAFPCDQFAGQEPGNSEEILCFAMKKNAKFDLFEKIDVNGDKAHPLWKYLKHKQGGTLGDFIKWNFTKFIVDKNGQPVERHGPKTDPSKLVSNLEKYW